MTPTAAGLQEGLRQSFPPRLWAHTLSVARLARRLAPAAGADPEQAYLAGLLHDHAKTLSQTAIKAALPKAALDPWEKGLPWLWHAPVGAWMARQRGIRDKDLLGAIRWHSTGAPGMSALQQALFVADYLEPGRKLAHARALRSLASRDFPAALKEVARHKLTFLLGRGARIHPRAIEMWNELMKRE